MEVVGKYFALSTPLEDLLGSNGKSLGDKIERHMDQNPGDWSVEFMFNQIGALDCSRARFAKLLEEAVHPLSRAGKEQLQTVAALNEILSRDGYELAQESELSGHPVYSFRPVARGVGGQPKNLIFASRGPKPEIGFADAINNDIVIIPEKRAAWSTTGLLAQTAFSGRSSSLGGAKSPKVQTRQISERAFKSWPQTRSASCSLLTSRPTGSSLARRCPHSCRKSISTTTPRSLAPCAIAFRFRANAWTSCCSFPGANASY